MQGTWVWSLEDSTRHGATEAMPHNYRLSHYSNTRQAAATRTPHPATREESLLTATRESSCAAMKTVQPEDKQTKTHVLGT